MYAERCNRVSKQIMLATLFERRKKKKRREGGQRKERRKTGEVVPPTRAGTEECGAGKKEKSGKVKIFKRYRVGGLLCSVSAVLAGEFFRAGR